MLPLSFDFSNDTFFCVVPKLLIFYALEFIILSLLSSWSSQNKNDEKQQAKQAWHSINMYNFGFYISVKINRRQKM